MYEILFAMYSTIYHVICTLDQYKIIVGLTFFDLDLVNEIMSPELYIPTAPLYDCSDEEVLFLITIFCRQ